MKSGKVEYIRFDDLKTGILMGNKPYILVQGDFNSLREVKTPMGQIELLEELCEQLRYDPKSKSVPDEKWNAIKKCSGQIASFFVDVDSLPDDISHLEVFLNPSELALVPFELLLTADGEPRFINENEKRFVLTRNFRRAVPSLVEMPKKPRVLYVHAKPSHKNYLDLPFPAVPHKNHEQSLRYALQHWDLENQLTVLANPTFDEFAQAIIQAEESERPYTHIHILAHGSLIFDHRRPSNFEYGIAFYSKQPLDTVYKATSTQEIKNLFDSLKSQPYLVNYMICDGANFTNGTKADKNPVQATFKAGVPIVIGSQFPLSMEGANLITKELYKHLFKGGDIRRILGDIRTKLYTSLPSGQHDWISLVSYVDLPNDYEFQLLLLKLEFQLVILNSIRTKTARTEAEGVPTKDDFIRARVQIEEAIADLSEEVAKIEHQKAQEAAFLENSGLLGSAYKRLAEIEFKASVLATDTLDKQILHLREAQKWYKKAADRNLSHHWSLIQYISLCTILDGGVEEQNYFNTAHLAALTEIESNNLKNKKSVWPYGTLIELYLLTPGADRADVKKTIENNVERLVNNAKEIGQPEAIVSTKFQLMRYLNWWGSSDFKIPDGLLAKDDKFIKSILKRCIADGDE